MSTQLRSKKMEPSRENLEDGSSIEIVESTDRLTASTRINAILRIILLYCTETPD